MFIIFMELSMELSSPAGLAAACGISLVLSHWLKPASTGIASAHTNKIQLCALKFSTIAVIGELEIFNPRK